MSVEPAFYSDQDVARRMEMSTSWVRGQRLKRVRGEHHDLTLDAVHIGRSVRYVRDEVEAFITSLMEAAR